MLRDTPNPYLEWIIALHQGRPAVNLTDSGLHTPLAELGPIDPATRENDHWELYSGLGPTLAARYGVTPAEVIPTLGTGGALFLVYAAHAHAGGAVLVEDPAYGPLLQVPQALGFRVDRFGLGAQNSPQLIKTLTDKVYMKLAFNWPIKRFLRLVRGYGEGLYIVGLDNHVGFLRVRSDRRVDFIHSSFSQPSAVLREDAGHSPILVTSRYRLVARLSQDLRLIKAWLTAKTLPTWSKPRRN